MRYILHSAIIVFMTGIMASCASGPQKKATTSSPATLGSALPAVDTTPFTKSVGTQTLGPGAGQGYNCPNSAKAAQGLSWKRLAQTTNACIQANEWHKVEQLAEMMATQHHLAPWGAYYLSLAAEHRKEFDRALWMIELAIKKSPKVGLLQYQKGRIHWALNNFNEAILNFNAAVEIDPKLIAAHSILGQIYFRDQDFDRAVKHMQIVLGADHNNVPALAGLGEIYARRNDPAKATEYLERAISHLPSHLGYRLRLAHVYEVQHKDIAKALETYRKIRMLHKSQRLKGELNFSLDDKIKSLEVALNKAEPGPKVSLREPAENKKVAK